MRGAGRIRYFGESELVARASTVLHKIEGTGFGAFHVKFGPGSILEKHVHPLPLFTTTVSGGSREYDRQTVLDLTTGTSRFAPAGLEHRVVVGERGEELVSVEVTAEFAHRDLLPATALVERARGPLHERGRRLLRELMLGDEYAPAVVEGIVLEIFAFIGRKAHEEPKAPPWLRRVVERLRGETDRVSLAELARDAGVHPGHLSRTFARHLHRTPAEYQRYVRIDKAMDLLRSTDRAVGDIAFDLGFYDETHFGRVFKQVTGWTPTAFRRARK